MNSVLNAPSTLSLSSSDTGICVEDSNRALNTILDVHSRIVSPSFEAIRNSFGKLYDINDFELEKIASGFFGDVYKVCPAFYYLAVL